MTGRTLPCEPHPLSGWCYVHDHDPKAGRGLSSIELCECEADRLVLRTDGTLYTFRPCPHVAGRGTSSGPVMSVRERCSRCGFSWLRCCAVRGCCIDCDHTTTTARKTS